jgi:hypothetical protein
MIAAEHQANTRHAKGKQQQDRGEEERSQPVADLHWAFASG